MHIPELLKFRVAVASVALAITGCAVAPSSPVPPPEPVSQSRAGAEDLSARPLYQRPPDKLFGIRQEQGSLGASPDVAGCCPLAPPFGGPGSSTGASPDE